MNTLKRSSVIAPMYPERILQFGEGNFLRAFVDWMVKRMNQKCDFDSGVVIVQPIEHGMADMINKQEGLYHLILQGIDKGKPIREIELIDSVSRAINPYADYADYKQLVLSPDLRFVISNTTEAGIAWDESDTLEQEPQKSFPGKMTALLYERFKAFDGADDKGLIIICCELIDRNADFLKKYVLQHAEQWNLEEGFVQWVNTACAFCNTLVDRIVPGFPKDNIKAIQQEIGYEDNLVVVGEYFHLWVIEAPQWVEDEFPAIKAGLNVQFVDDMTRFRDQKVRVLNGAHTGTFALSLLYGVETVKEAIEHEKIGAFMHQMLGQEILKTIAGDEAELEVFVEKILERFYNPYVRHEWKSIALNSMSKWQTRNLCSLIDYVEKEKDLPSCLVFSLATLSVYYRGEYKGETIVLQDDQASIDFMKKVWANFDLNKDYSVLATAILAYEELWGRDLNQLNGLSEKLAQFIESILTEGVEKTLDLILMDNE
ncbi:MAG: tagaturonate reductase [Bacteroidales bacterium]|jgi:tagaturonate reductase|nr:tagaturonate reductase [Bacteroidales bacterium]